MRRMAVAGLLAVAHGALVPALEAFPEIEGFRPVGEVEAYGKDDLWKYIDGAADLFLAYGFRQLEARDVESGDLRLTVQVYDMGTPLAAFGVLSIEGGRDAIRPGIGAGWAASLPEQCLLAKDRFYVKVDATRGGLSEASAKAIADAVARALPGSDGPPGEFERLPGGSYAPGSARYTTRGFLGLSEMPPCVHALLEGGPSGAEIFVVLPREGETIEAVWSALASKWDPIEGQGFPALARQVPYRGSVGAVRSERGIVGLAGFASRDELVKRLASLARGGP